jgi:putative transposase
VSVALSEHEVHWRTFLQNLVARGLCGVQLIISDAHEGLKAARAVCQVLCKNRGAELGSV